MSNKKETITGLKYIGSFPMYEGKKKGVIYTVTSIHSNIEEHSRDTRCWGFYVDYKDALKAVSMNAADMHECKYNYVIIEEVPSGICPTESKVLNWFKWNEKTSKWKSIKIPPKWSRGIIGWSIG